MKFAVRATLFAVCVVVALLECIQAIGIPTGCDDGRNYCTCGETERTFSMSYERCTYFYRWRPYCKECNEDLDFVAQCAQYQYCQTCDNNVDSCVSCPSDRYGKWCDMICHCQNNGECNSNGTCMCSDRFEGDKCERRKPVYCPYPSVPPNARLEKSLQQFIGGSSVTIMCNQNYQLIGSSRLLCDFNGDWIGDLPKCEPICEALETPNGGLAIVTSVPGTSVVRSILYDCLNGYQISGLDRIDCKQDGTWSGVPPVCVAKCDRPKRPTYGSVALDDDEAVQLEGSRATYTCNRGYTLRGPGERLCGPDRQWTQTSPICDPVECGIPDIPEHGFLYATNFTFGGVVSYTCEENYIFSKPDVKSRLCKFNGEWSGNTPQCIKDVSCPDPGVGPNIVRVPDASVHTFHAGDILSFSCGNTFTMVKGEETRVCLTTGSWSGDQPVCLEETSCHDPGIPKYSVRQVSQPALKTRSFDRTRIVQSSSLASSESSASSSDSISTSGIEEEFMADEDQEQEQNNYLTEGYFTHGTQLAYSCKSNLYQLYGSSHLTCSGGKWRGHIPTCKPVCGKASGEKQAYVVGGNDTIGGMWPWNVAIYKYKNGTGSKRLICGASILTETLVVTAAHCVKDRFTHLFKVEVGKYYRTHHKRDEEWIQSRNVADFFVHHNYNPSTLDSDIAVLRLETPIEFTARVRPVCLPSISSTKRNLRPGKEGVLTGWGRTGEGLPTVLQQAIIPVVSRLRCQRNYRDSYPENINIFVTRNMFCAGFEEGGVDSCTGDSGSPMVFSRGTGEMKSWYLEGIVSWGSPDQCGLPKEFGVYTKVSKYLAWLREFGISN
ncbi:clotting factor C-like isoform X2 [Antedon mediterranea]|uniref:clotting factor C-like isoform X2 n=1 Tax=Antedon mediterranea TaxID=105859 RepID=UPI003AF8E848